ncbi:MAG TPA: hypothetical protein VJK30_04355 [Coxiellaceae bacterium]|nr:MAG: hypothetical protein A3E81_07625 [Gammaproteobacteria bacterium RIFCSPHIGHO2_12_FULL_36_30]HLB56541.1 hypothetical protein [Coxiellaceae bacterium]
MRTLFTAAAATILPSLVSAASELINTTNNQTNSSIGFPPYHPGEGNNTKSSGESVEIVLGVIGIGCAVACAFVMCGKCCGFFKKDEEVTLLSDNDRRHSTDDNLGLPPIIGVSHA